MTPEEFEYWQDEQFARDVELYERARGALREFQRLYPDVAGYVHRVHRVEGEDIENAEKSSWIPTDLNVAAFEENWGGTDEAFLKICGIAPIKS